MPLQVWLPLNGNLKNKGVANFSCSNTAPSYITIDNNGKIGKCFNFNSSSNNSGIFSADNGFMNKYINNKSWSLCAWILTTSTDTCIMSLSYGLRIFAGDQSHTNVSLYNSSRAINCSSSIAVNDGKWHHIIVTYNVNTNKITFYVDGIVRGTQNYADGYTYASSWVNGIFIGKDPNNSVVNDHYLFKGKLNDVRIYDHCLSTQEIKEISKGLIAHYPLDNNGLGNENLFSYQNKGASPITLNTYQNTGSFTQFSNILSFDPSTTVGEKYTISLWARSPNGTTSLQLYNSNSNPRYFYFSTTLTSNLGTEWEYFTFTFTNNDRGSGSVPISNRIEIYMSQKTGGQVKMIKIEKGEKATPWCVGSGDSSYVNSNIVYDCSGNGYNGTITGTLDTNSNTPRYTSCQEFDGVSFISATPLCSEVKTLSVWVKTTKNKTTNQMICIDSASLMAIGFWQGNIIGVVGSGAGTGSKCTLGSSYKENDWNHIVVVDTGSKTRDIYCNGVKLTPTSNDYWSTYNTGFFVGSRNNSSSLPFFGYMSDLKAYATALSEADILDLYHTSAKIDKNGNLFAYNYEE